MNISDREKRGLETKTRQNNRGSIPYSKWCLIDAGHLYNTTDQALVTNHDLTLEFDDGEKFIGFDYRIIRFIIITGEHKFAENSV